MHWSIAPTLVKKASRAVQVVKKGAVFRQRKKLHRRNLKVQPEVAEIIQLRRVVVLHKRHKTTRQRRKRAKISLGRAPEAWNCVCILKKQEHKSVPLVVRTHEVENVISDIAEESYPGLHAPVVLVLRHKRVPVEKAQEKPAHVPIAFAGAVENVFFCKLASFLCCYLLVDPAGVQPMRPRDLSKAEPSVGNESDHRLHQLHVKRLVVQEHPVVVEPVIVAIFDRLNGLEQLIDLVVSAKHKICSVGARSGARFLNDNGSGSRNIPFYLVCVFPASYVPVPQID